MSNETERYISSIFNYEYDYDVFYEFRKILLAFIEFARQSKDRNNVENSLLHLIWNQSV